MKNISWVTTEFANKQNKNHCAGSKVAGQTGQIQPVAQKQRETQKQGDRGLGGNRSDGSPHRRQGSGSGQWWEGRGGGVGPKWERYDAFGNWPPVPEIPGGRSVSSCRTGNGRLKSWGGRGAKEECVPIERGFEKNMALENATIC